MSVLHCRIWCTVVLQPYCGLCLRDLFEKVFGFTCDVIRRKTRSVSASQFFCWATLADICPAILMLSLSFQPSILTCRTLSVFSGPLSSILITWWSPPGSSLVTQPMCLESKSIWDNKRSFQWNSLFQTDLMSYAMIWIIRGCVNIFFFCHLPNVKRFTDNLCHLSPTCLILQRSSTAFPQRNIIDVTLFCQNTKHRLYNLLDV